MGEPISIDLQKYWLANGLNVSDQSNLALKAKEGQALFYLSAATLPFLVYALFNDFSYLDSPVEFVSYCILSTYVLFLVGIAYFNKSFRSNLRPWIVYALPLSALVQYLNMYITGPDVANMLSIIITIIFGSVIVKRNIEVAVLMLFTATATGAIVFLRDESVLLASFVPGILACLMFVGMAQYFRNQQRQFQEYRTQMLAYSVEIWDHVLDKGSLVMALLNTKGQIVEINKNDHIYSKEAVVGHDFVDLLADDQRRIFSSSLKAVLDAKKSTSCKLTMVSKKKSLLRLAITFWPIIENDSVVGVMSFALDVSAQEIDEQKMLQTTQLAILGEISATIAHEIRNPLTVISGNAEVMILQINKMNEGRIFLPRLEKIKQMSERIVNIVKNVRRMYHSGETEPLMNCRVAEVIDDATSFCTQKCLEYSIELKVEQEDEHIVVNGKPLMLSQAILNLMHNAIDAVRVLEEKWIKIEVLDSLDSVQISVIDSGSGISPDVLKHVGQPFYTTKSAGNGNGLGVNLAKRVVEDHGGTFKYDTKSSYTKFDLILPKDKAA